jgi:LPXTG-motif cell wall-anchored protein
LLTEAAGGDVLGTGTAAVSTAVVAATALPTTGFADEIGLPGLLGISALLIGVILLVRRMRAATHE